MFLCFGKLPKVQLSVMTNTGKYEHLKLTKLPYNTLSRLTALSCQPNSQDVGKLDIPGYGITNPSLVLGALGWPFQLDMVGFHF